MKRDDRPKQTRYIDKAKKKKPLRCATCGAAFAADAVAGEDYTVRKDGAAYHRDSRTCRVAQLAVNWGVELGANPPETWLFARYPRDQILERWDVRPKDWEKIGWMPRWPGLEERVMAVILYHSICYPVALPYAVQLAWTCPLAGRVDLDPDELLQDKYKHFIPLRAKDIARILNEDGGIDKGKGNMSRAIKRLVDRKELRVDQDHVLYPAAKIEPCSILERQDLYRQRLIHAHKKLRGVPKACLPWLERIEAECPEDVSTHIFDGVKRHCTTFRTELKDIRTDLFKGVKEECSAALSFLPDLFTISRSSSSSPSPSSVAPPQSHNAPVDDVEQTPINELYEAGLGQGALAKLPAKHERSTAMILARLTAFDSLVDGDAVRQLVAAAPKDCGVADLLAAIDAKAGQAAKARRPIGFLLKAVPNLLSGDGLQRLREEMAKKRQAGEEATLRRERADADQQARQVAIAEKVLSSPDATEQEKALAREVLGISKAGGAGGQA